MTSANRLQPTRSPKTKLNHGGNGGNGGNARNNALVQVPAQAPVALDVAPVRMINVIHGVAGEGHTGSSIRARTWYVPAGEVQGKRFRPSETITFSEADAVPPQVPHSDPMVISAEVEGFLVKRVFIDDGSSVEIMFA